MITKKKLRAEICQLNDEIIELQTKAYRLEGAYEDQISNQQRKVIQLLGKNADLTSKQAHYLEILNEQNGELVRFNKEQTRLLNALQRKQVQLDQEIVSRIESEEMFESLKGANSSQSKKIVVMFNALESAKVQLCNARVALASIQGNLDRVARFPI